MSGIKELDKLNSRQLESVKRRQDQEIKNLQTAHQNYKASVQKQQASEIVDLRNENHRYLDQENAKKEKVLEEMRGHLQNTQQLTDKELKNLKTMSATEKEKINQKLSDDRTTVISENELFLDELNHRFQQQNRKINDEGQSRIDSLTQDLSQKHSATQEHFQKKLNDQSSNFATRFQQENFKQKKIQDDQDKQFKDQRVNTNLRQQQDLSKLTTQHTDAFEKRDTQFRKGLAEQDLFFESKYATTLSTRNEELKRLEDLHDNVMSKMKTSLAKELTKSADRSDDPFYQFSELRPKMTQYPDRVEIKVAVPEYAKEDMQLTMNNKEAILNFNRRYTDSNRGQDGTINKVNKVESFTSRLKAAMALDPKSVKQSFEDGVMTYTIKYA